MVIVDYDVHAGNGTQNCIQHLNMDNVFFVSIHRRADEFYPHNHDDKKFGSNVQQANIMNVPMPPHYTDQELAAVMQVLVGPGIQKFRDANGNREIELLYISNGLDAHRADPNSHENTGYVEDRPNIWKGAGGLSTLGFGHQVAYLVENFPAAKIVLASEGGYNPDMMNRIWQKQMPQLVGKTGSEYFLNEIQKGDSQIASAENKQHYENWSLDNIKSGMLEKLEKSGLLPADVFEDDALLGATIKGMCEEDYEIYKKFFGKPSTVFKWSPVKVTKKNAKDDYLHRECNIIRENTRDLIKKMQKQRVGTSGKDIDQMLN